MKKKKVIPMCTNGILESLTNKCDFSLLLFHQLYLQLQRHTNTVLTPRAHPLPPHEGHPIVAEALTIVSFLLPHHPSYSSHLSLEGTLFPLPWLKELPPWSLKSKPQVHLPIEMRS